MLVLRLPKRLLAVVAAVLGLAAVVLWAWNPQGPGVRPADGACGEARNGTETEMEAGTSVETAEPSSLPAQAQDDGPITVQHPEQLRIVIDRDAQTLTLYEAGRPIASFPVAVGKENTPSPPGEWLVVHKDRGWGGGFGTRWLGLNVPWGIYGIHGTNKPWSIGTNASAGCIRMFNRDVERLWDVVPLRTPVTITGQLPEVAARDTLQEGTSGKFAMVLQFRLRQAGYDYGAMDARYGPATAAAVRNFQVLFGFEATGALTRDQQYLLWYPD